VVSDLTEDDVLRPAYDELVAARAKKRPPPPKPQTAALSDEELAGQLKRQLLELAIGSDNVQLKLDIYKATVERGKAKPVEPEPAADQMTMFRTRVTRAESANGSE
jgi:hypothetical protein